MPRLSIKRKALLDQVMHDNLCEAAMRVITECGVDNMTMDKVAEAAGVAKGTIYNYFKNKDELLAKTENAIFDPMVKRIKVIIAADSAPLSKLREIAGVILEHFSRYKKVLVLLHESRISGILGNRERFEKREKIISIIAGIITPAMQCGELRSFNPRIVAEIFIGMIMSINISKVISGEERSRQEDLDTVMGIFAQGMRTKEESVNEY
jgi:AcrR family transcriptional regulator